MQVLHAYKTASEDYSCAKYQYERFDEGYPEGLAGKDIPLLARIIAIADTYDEYIREAISKGDESVERNWKDEGGSGSRFDPDIVTASGYRQIS